MFQPYNQDAADKSIRDQVSDSVSDSGKDSIGVNNSDRDSNIRNDTDSDNDSKPYVLIQDSVTTAATDGAIAYPTRTHVDADPTEIRRTSTRNKKAPS
jgi:hypothetical protein